MQTRVEKHPEYKDKIENDPIALLKAIQTLMHDAVRAQYPYVSMTDALSRVVNIRQQENESLLDYVKRFKQQRDILKSHVGTKVLNDFIEQSEEFRNEKSTTKQDEMKEEAMERWMAYLFLKGSDQTKYGSVMRGFVDLFSLENNQYPKTVAIATDILSNHKLDQRFYDVQKRNKERQRQENDEPNETSFAQSNSKTMLIC